jgi:hypothetical protein
MREIMAGYQFPDNELQKITTLVSKITGDHMGLNQLYNPDETHTIAGEHSIKILSHLQEMQEACENADIAKLRAAAQAYETEVSIIKRHPEDSNPLLSELLQQSKKIVSAIETDPYYRVEIRMSELSSQKVKHDDLVYPIQATREINELINNAIQDLERANQGRSIPLINPDEKKSMFAKFFSSKPNKIVDSSQIQRMPQAEIDNAVSFLKQLASALPAVYEADTLDIILPHVIAELKIFVDSSPQDTSALTHDTLSRLTAGLQNYHVYLCNPHCPSSSNVKDILTTCIEDEFDHFLTTSAGMHYVCVAAGSENNSPYKKELSNEELENFNASHPEDLDEKLDVLLTLLPDDKYNKFYEKIANAYEEHYERLIEDHSQQQNSKLSGPAI